MLGIIRRAFSFADWNVHHPKEPPPGDMLDASFDALIQRISELESLLYDVRRSDGQLVNDLVGADQLHPDLREYLRISAKTASNGDELGWKTAEATADVWAHASQDWAEHMPDTIPENSVAVMDITGDHWSSRWWANQASQLVAGNGGFDGVYIGPAAPASSKVSQLWWNSTNGNLYVRYDDGDSIQWVQINTGSGIGDGGILPFDTRADIKAYPTNRLSTVWLREAGRTGIFQRLAGVPAFADPSEGLTLISDTPGFYWGRVLQPRDRLFIEWFGAVGNGIVDNETAIENAFAMADARGLIACAADGVFMIGGMLRWDVKYGFSFHASKGTIFKAASSFPVDTPFIWPNCSVAGGVNIPFKWKGGKIDGSLMPAKVAVASPDLLSIGGANLRQIVVEDVWLYANADRTGLAADTCLAIALGTDFTVRDCVFQGAVDCGIYLTGDNAPANSGRRCEIIGNTFLECYTGFATKRVFEDHVVSGNFVKSCDAGIATTGVPGTGPGKKIVISNNIVRDCGTGIMVSIADGSVVSGNRIENYGISRAGAQIAGEAIRIYGSSYCVVTGNVAIIDAAVTPVTGCAAIKILPAVQDSITYQSTYNLITGNVLQHSNIGIDEQAASNNNQIIDNHAVGMVTRYSVVGSATSITEMRPESGVSWTKFGASGITNPIAGVNTVVENDGNLIYNFLTPNTNSTIWAVGDPDNVAIARMAYDHATDRWYWRSGGSVGSVLEIDSTNVRMGTFTTNADAPVTGYITIKDLAGNTRKLATIA